MPSRSINLLFTLFTLHYIYILLMRNNPTVRFRITERLESGIALGVGIGLNTRINEPSGYRTLDCRVCVCVVKAPQKTHKDEDDIEA